MEKRGEMTITARSSKRRNTVRKIHWFDRHPNCRGKECDAALHNALITIISRLPREAFRLLTIDNGIESTWSWTPAEKWFSIFVKNLFRRRIYSENLPSLTVLYFIVATSKVWVVSFFSLLTKNIIDFFRLLYLSIFRS